MITCIRRLPFFFISIHSHRISLSFPFSRSQSPFPAQMEAGYRCLTSAMPIFRDSFSISTPCGYMILFELPSLKALSLIRRALALCKMGGFLLTPIPCHPCYLWVSSYGKVPCIKQTVMSTGDIPASSFSMRKLEMMVSHLFRLSFLAQ